MPVFLSHKKEDTKITLDIAEHLKENGVVCYVDVFDPELQSTSDITEKLIQRIGQCTHLMAVVSKYTEKSWWVPFEIGVGTEKERRICSCELYSKSKLPEFLEKWPILRIRADLDKFVYFYKRDSSVPFSESYEAQNSIFSAEQFHRELMAQL